MVNAGNDGMEPLAMEGGYPVIAMVLGVLAVGIISLSPVWIPELSKALKKRKAAKEKEQQHDHQQTMDRHGKREAIRLGNYHRRLVLRSPRNNRFLFRPATHGGEGRDPRSPANTLA